MLLVQCVSVFKYLGITFTAGKALDVDMCYVKRRYYSSVNSILCKAKLSPEPVKVQLVKSHVLPHVVHSIGTLDLCEKKVRHLNSVGIMLLELNFL